MTTIWINGCFDILHRGHLAILKYASSLGDRLVVGIDSDYRIKEKKGDSRPINDHFFRKEMLESLRFVDKVYIFESDYQLEQYILQNAPCKMVIGNDYKGEHIIGSQHCKEVVFFNRIPGCSTTDIIHKINSNGKTN